MKNEFPCFCGHEYSVHSHAHEERYIFCSTCFDTLEPIYQKMLITSDQFYSVIFHTFKADNLRYIEELSR